MSRARTMHSPKVLEHRGLDFKRRAYNHREEAFAAYWEEENQRRRWLNFGFGILQDLMIKRAPVFSIFARVTWRLVINNRDAAICATVVQWLGTNVGMAFLETALKRCGYRLVRDEAWLDADDCCGVCHGRGRKGMKDGKVICGWCQIGFVAANSWNKVRA